MKLTDPIADMLTRVRNAQTARHQFALVPASKMKIAIAKILKDEGFIKDWDMMKDAPHPTIRIWLKYAGAKQPVIGGLRRVSKGGLRVYTKRSGIPRVRGGLGIAILSTPQGVMTGRDAWRNNVGGEVVCYVW